MNGAVLLVFGVVFFVLAYRFYGGYLVRLFGVDPSRPTPATTRRDGVDYVPTRLPVLFGHHFASIAGAGPIVGPVLAVYLGWAPVALWILLGAVFVGAMHDFAALFLSVRGGGRSIGHIIEGYLGYWGRQLFLVFSWAALVLVVAIFAIIVARTFTAEPAVATASLLFIAMAPVFGYLVHRRSVSIIAASAVFVPLLFVSVWIGVKLPLDLTALVGMEAGSARSVWLAVLFVYVFVASIIPVWLLLQPRDYLNSFLLYAMVAMGLIGIIWASPTYQLPAFAGWSAAAPGGKIGHLFPILYVTVACGACSGFHSLVSSGTTAKQLSSERHMLPVGYGAMLVEGLVALMALTSVAVLTRSAYVDRLGELGPVATFATGLAGFAESFGMSPSIGTAFVSLAISAFLLTTLDTATRLARFTWQELFLPRARDEAAASSPSVIRRTAGHPFVATAMVVGLAGFLTLSGSASEIWPVFGAANQLLAALTLLVVTLVLVRRRSNFWVALVPFLFMVTITVWALWSLLDENWKVNDALTLSVLLLLLTATALVAMALPSLLREQRQSRHAAEGEVSG